MGAGAIGSLFGGFLAEDGNDVALIARESHVKAIERNGLIIEGASGKHVVKVKAVTKPAHLKETFDLILLTVKAYDTRQAVTEAQKLMGNTSVLLCLQNGLGMEQIASEIIGRDRVLRGVTINGVILKESGLIMHTGKGETTIGELNGRITVRTQKIAEVFSEAGLLTRVTNNIEGTVWTKILINAGINPFGALTGMKNGELMMFPELKELMVETVIEGTNVARKINVKLEGDPVSLMIKTVEMTAQNRNSMLQDVEKGKRTEIDFINGAISNLGKRVGVKTPLNNLLTSLVKGLEANRLKMR
jgi:2-dehydropantoate 2-reductase